MDKKRSMMKEKEIASVLLAVTLLITGTLSLLPMTAEAVEGRERRTSNIGIDTDEIKGEEANFQVTDLNIEPENATSWELIEVETTIENTGESSGEQDVNFSVQNKFGHFQLEDNKTLDLDLEENETVSFETSRGEKGTYEVKIETENDEKEGKFTVDEKAYFNIERWKIDPKEVGPGETVEIEAEVKNIGGADDDFTLELLIDGELEDWETDELDVGDSTTVTFLTDRDDEGVYNVTLATQDHEKENITSFNVTGGKFEINRWNIDPEEPEPKEEVEIEFEVENVGETTDDFTVEFLVDEDLEGWDTDSLAPDETTIMSFSVSKEEAREYDFEVNIIGHETLEDSFEVVEIEPLDVRLPDGYDYREWIYQGETFKSEIEIYNSWTGELDGVKLNIGEDIREYNIGTIGADDTKTQELRVSPEDYTKGIENEIEVEAEHDYGSASKILNFRVHNETYPVEVFLASTNAPIYENQTLEVSLVVAAAHRSGVEDLVVRTESEGVTPEGYWVGETMKEAVEVEEIDEDEIGDELVPIFGDGALLNGDDGNEGGERVIVGRRMMFERINIEEEGELEFNISYEIGNLSVGEKFSVEYETKESGSVSLIESDSVIGVEGDRLTVPLEISNEKSIDVEGVKIRPVKTEDVDPQEIDIYPSPSYWVGPLDSDEFLPAEFRVDSEELEDGDTLKFEPVYRVGDGELTGTPVEITVNLLEPEEDIGILFYLGIIAIIALIGFAVYWHKRSEEG